jgi:thioredoxin-related protein
MRWLLLTLLLFVGPWHTASVLAETRDPSSHFFMPRMGDFKEELATAKQEGKQAILIMFEMDECPFCARMKANVLNQSPVQEYFRRHFLVFDVNVKGDTPVVDFKGKSTTEKAFALEQRARATPVFIFYDLGGNPLTRFTGATQTADEFLLLGRYVADGVYKTGVPFNVYRKQAQPQ